MPDNQELLPELHIYKRTSPEKRLKLWPGISGEHNEGLIQENQDYVLELVNVTNPDDVDLYIDDIPVEALRSRNKNIARWRWSPGFYAGIINIRINFLEGRRETFEIITDPDLRKLTRKNFNQMVREILEDTLALFSLSSFRTGIAKGTGQTPPPIARLEFLRSRIEEIIDTIHQINRHPVRILQNKVQWIPAYQAKTFTGSEILRSLNSGDLTRAQDENIRKRLPAKLKGYFPQKIRKQVKTDGLNIREHQEIKAAIKSWSALLELYASILNNSKPQEEHHRQHIKLWINRCHALSRKIQALLTLPLFRDIADRNIFPAISSIYRRIPAYRKFFQLYQDINLGISNVSSDFLQVPLARTFDLYELWCFLRLLRVLSQRYKNISIGQLFEGYSPDSGTLTIPAGNVIIPFAENKAILFQRSYVEFWKDAHNRGSFSRPMRPDISFEFANGRTQFQVLVLDAKYRIEEQLNNAITSIHMYRDAIVQADNESQDNCKRIVTAAYILTPHLVSHSHENNWKNLNLRGRLFHREYRGTFKFGAVTLSPGMLIEEISQILEEIFEDAGLQDHTIN